MPVSLLGPGGSKTLAEAAGLCCVSGDDVIKPRTALYLLLLVSGGGGVLCSQMGERTYPAFPKLLNMSCTTEPRGQDPDTAH